MKFAALLIGTVAASYNQDYGYGYNDYHQPAYQPQQYASVGYREDYLKQEKPLLTWDSYEAPISMDREITMWERAEDVRPRPHYADFDEYAKEDWDTDLWAQQELKYALDDERDALEGDASLNQDAERAEFDDWWETYRKPATHEDIAYGYGEDYGYGHHTKVDVRETILRANELWNADVVARRQQWRDTLAAERDAHRAAVAGIVAGYDAEVAEIKAAMLRARQSKREDVAAMNGEMRAEVAALIAASHGEVADENAAHNALVLELLEAVDYYGAEADIKLILEAAGESGIDLYGDHQVRALFREEVAGEYENAYPSAAYHAVNPYGETTWANGYATTGHYY